METDQTTIPQQAPAPEKSYVAIDRFGHPQYLVKRKILKLFGAHFHVHGPDGEVVFFSNMKAFKLKEDIRIYSDETMAEELLLIQARRIVDFSAAYDVIDAKTSEKVGALKRKGWKSMLRDEWILMDAADNEVGKVLEDSTLFALLRRFATNLIPQNYGVHVGDAQVAEFRQNFNPFTMRLTLDFSPDSANVLDRRLGLAAGILLGAIEGKQK